VIQEMKSRETDSLSERKMNEILQKLQGNEENHSGTGKCVFLIIVLVGSLKMVIEVFWS
jgi:hypothetical protein